MKNFFMILLLLFLPHVAFAYDAECKKIFDQKNENRVVDLKLYTIQPKLKYDNSRNKSSLTRMSDQHRHSKNVSVNGLTVAQFNSGLEGDFMVVDLQDGTACVLPKKVSAKIGYTQIKVYIASEYRPGSCEYASTIEHENEHVKANINTFNREIQNIKNKTSQFIQQKFPARVKANGSNKIALQIIQKEFVKYINGMERKRDMIHSKLDSPESYKYSISKCKNW